MTRKIPTLLVLFSALAMAVAGCSSGGATEAPATTPDKAVLQVTRGLADGRPEVVWNALPPSYQREVTDLVHEAAGTMDAEVWGQSFQVLEKLVLVLEQKRDFILSHPMLASQMKDRSEAERNWDGVVGVVGVLVRSDLADLERLRTLDVGAFLAGTGGRFMRSMAEASALSAQDPWGQAMTTLRETRATVLSSSGDEATVRIEAPDQPSQEMPFVRVEGRWIPKQMADEWPQTMAEAREALASMSPETMQQGKQALLMQLSMAEGALDSLLQAETEAEFHAGLGSIMGLAMGAMMSQGMQAGGSMSPPGGPALDLRPPAEVMFPDGEHQDGPASDEPMPSIPTTAREPATAEPLSVKNADQYVGRTLKVVTRDGREVTGTLVAVRGETLVFEKTFGGGSVTVQFERRDIESLSWGY